MSGLYRDVDAYGEQLGRLEQHVRSNPREAYTHFLLAYHYVTLGRSDEARFQLQEVVSLDRRDRLAKDLLDLLQRATQGDEFSRAGSVHTPQPLQGDWNARRSDGRIELDVDDDQFIWDYDLDSNDEKLKGKFVLVQDLLVFATSQGSQMAGRVRMIDRDTFSYRLISRDDDDSGIVFRRD